MTHAYIILCMSRDNHVVTSTLLAVNLLWLRIAYIHIPMISCHAVCNIIYFYMNLFLIKIVPNYLTNGMEVYYTTLGIAWETVYTTCILMHTTRMPLVRCAMLCRVRIYFTLCYFLQKFSLFGIAQYKQHLFLGERVATMTTALFTWHTHQHFHDATMKQSSASTTHCFSATVVCTNMHKQKIIVKRLVYGTYNVL